MKLSTIFKKKDAAASGPESSTGSSNNLNETAGEQSAFEFQFKMEDNTSNKKKLSKKKRSKLAASQSQSKPEPEENDDDDDVLNDVLNSSPVAAAAMHDQNKHTAPQADASSSELAVEIKEGVQNNNDIEPVESESEDENEVGDTKAKKKRKPKKKKKKATNDSESKSGPFLFCLLPFQRFNMFVCAEVPISIVPKEWKKLVPKEKPQQQGDAASKTDKSDTAKTKEKKQQQAPNNSSSSKVTSKGANSAATKTTSKAPTTKASSTTAPHGISFISAKDSELDEATRLKVKYGQGKNLVAIGPPKRKGVPAWIQPPPGFEDVTPASQLPKQQQQQQQQTKASTIKPMDGGVGGTAAAAAVALHSSPFSFGFGFNK